MLLVKSGMKVAAVAAVMVGLSGCGDDMQLLDEEQKLFGGCHNVYQMMVKGKPQPMIRADAVFLTETLDQNYLTLAKGDGGLEIDMTKCDSDSMQAFDQVVDAVEGPSGRVVGKLIR